MSPLSSFSLLSFPFFPPTRLPTTTDPRAYQPTVYCLQSTPTPPGQATAYPVPSKLAMALNFPWIYPVRVIQVIFAIIVLGLTAYSPLEPPRPAAGSSMGLVLTPRSD